MIRDCDQADKKAISRPGLAEWRKEDPGPNGPFEKTMDGVTCKWCGKCRFGKGLWMMGARAHTTEEHRSRKEQAADAETKTKPSGGMAVAWSDPVEVDFG